MRTTLYIRIVSDNIRNATSYQERELGRWSDEYGHEIVKVFKDDTPGVLVECFKLQRLLAQLDAHTFNGVVVRGLNRLARSYYDFPQLVDKFRKVEVKIIASRDTDNAFTECETSFHILNALEAAWERA